jgi:hypothetical protein
MIPPDYLIKETTGRIPVSQLLPGINLLLIRLRGNIDSDQ